MTVKFLLSEGHPFSLLAMKILMSGSSGLIGSKLSIKLKQAGHTLVRLVRHKTDHPNEIFWDIPDQKIELKRLEGFDAVVHLAGEGIADQRWTEPYKRKIYSSRIDGTKLLVDSFFEITNSPPRFISASAIGFYGDRGDENLREEAGPGKIFLSKVCQDWEKEAERLNLKSSVAMARFSAVLSTKGGALEKMLLPFRLGLGGPLGSGKQYFPWIHIDDVVGGLIHLINHPSITGPVNFAGVETIRQKDFAKRLGTALHRPAFFPTPEFALKLVLGKMATELLLVSAKVIPQKLLDSGYRFEHPEVEEALSHLLSELC